MADTSLGNMFVSFYADTTKLQEGISQAKSLLSDFGSSALGMCDDLASRFGNIGSPAIDTSEITSGLDEVASAAIVSSDAIAEVGDASDTTSEKIVEASAATTGFKDSLALIGSATTQLAQNIGGVLVGRLSILGNGIADIGIKMGNAASGPINNLIGRIQNLSSTIGGVASSAFDAFSSRVQDISSTIGGVASSAFDKFSSGVQDIASKVNDAVSGPLNAFSNGVQQVASNISDAASNALDKFTTSIQRINSTINDAVSGPLNAFKSGIQDISSKVSDAVSGPLNNFTSGVQDIASKVNSAVSGPFNSFISSIQSFASDIEAAASGPLADLISGIRSLSSNLSEAASGPLNSFKQGMSDMGSSMGGMFQQVLTGSGRMEGLKTGFSSVVSGAQSFVGGIMNAGSSVMDFVGNLGFGIMNLQIIGQTAMSTAEQLLGPAESAETMETAFDTLMGSTKAATDELNKLDAFASKTPFKTMEIDQAASQLIGFGVNAKDVIPDLTSIGDALSAVGKGSAANLGQIVNIFGKMQTSGKLTGQDMQQFSADGINAWGILEKQTGKTQAQLEQMISAGLFPAKDAMAALTKGIEANPLYAGGMAKQSATMAGLLSTLKSNWDQMLASFGSPILKGLEPIVSNIGNALSSQGFKDFGSNVGKKVADAFKSIGDFVTKNDIGGKIQELGKNLSGFFSNPDIKTFAKEVGVDLVNGFKNFMNAVSSPEFGTFIKDVGAFVTGSLIDLYNGIKNVGQAVINTTNFFKDHKLAMDALVSVLSAVGIIIASILIPAFIGWAIAMGGVVIEALILAAPFILVGIIIAAVIFGIILAVQHWGDIVKWLQGVWGGLVGFFGGIMDGIVGAFRTGINWLIDQINGFISGINSINVAGFSVHIPLIPHLASGIENFTGGLALVGEKGPELVNLPKGSSVLNHDKTASAFSGMNNNFKYPSMAGQASYSPQIIVQVHNDKPAPIYIDGHELTNRMAPHMANMIRLKGDVRSR
jgi:tape measure domain-containing protein